MDFTHKSRFVFIISMSQQIEFMFAFSFEDSDDDGGSLITVIELTMEATSNLFPELEKTIFL